MKVIVVRRNYSMGYSNQVIDCDKYELDEKWLTIWKHDANGEPVKKYWISLSDIIQIEAEA